MEETLCESDFKGYLRALEDLDRIAEQIESSYTPRSFNPAEQTRGTSSGRSDPTGSHTVKRERLEEDLEIARAKAGEAYRSTLDLIDRATNRPEIPTDTLKVLLDMYLDGRDIKEAAIRSQLSVGSVKYRLGKVWKIPRNEIFKD